MKNEYEYGIHALFKNMQLKLHETFNSSEFDNIGFINDIIDKYLVEIYFDKENGNTKLMENFFTNVNYVFLKFISAHIAELDNYNSNQKDLVNKESHLSFGMLRDLNLKILKLLHLQIQLKNKEEKLSYEIQENKQKINENKNLILDILKRIQTSNNFNFPSNIEKILSVLSKSDPETFFEFEETLLKINSKNYCTRELVEKNNQLEETIIKMFEGSLNEDAKQEDDNIQSRISLYLELEKKRQYLEGECSLARIKLNEKQKVFRKEHKRLNNSSEDSKNFQLRVTIILLCSIIGVICVKLLNI